MKKMIALGIAAWLGTTALHAQGPPAQSEQKPMSMDACKQMMSRHQQMMSEMQAMENKLDELVASMNAAPDAKAKLNAMAAVLTELVSQRRQMRERVMDMQSQMMGHMMGHMQEGPASAMQCPMMQKMRKP
jgi:hypothetical protein